MQTVGQIQAVLQTAIKPGKSFIAMLNQALASLYARGNWKGLKAEWRSDVSAGYFRLPPDYEAVLNARIQDVPIVINGMEYEYQTRGPGLVQAAAGVEYGVIDQGFVPLMSEISTDGLDSLDFNLTVGTYSTGDTIVIDYTTDDGPNTATLSPTSGASVTFTPSDTVISIEAITYTSLPARVLVEDDNDYLYAILLPGDGVARYRSYKVPQVPEDTTQEWILNAVLKRAFLPCVTSSDKVYLDNILALKYALSAVTYEDAGDEDRAAINWKKATDILQQELSESRGGAKVIPQFEIHGAGVQPVASLYG